MTDHDDLVARYSTPLESLTPEDRELVERHRKWEQEQRAAGNFISPEVAARQDTPIGLDDNNQPFPLRDTKSSQPSDERADDE